MAGEASADLHGANLVKALHRRDPGLEFCGIGGRAMERAGVRLIASSSEMAVVGLTEVLGRVRSILGAAGRLKSLLRTRRPALLILIDYPDFNIHMAGVAKRLDVPVLYYISPQVWAWRSGRVRKIARRVDRMAVILPFEEAFYRNRGMRVDYVGHPLMDALPATVDREAVAARLRVDPERCVVGLLPGSRKEEIRNLLPVMIRAMERLSTEYPGLLGLLPLAPTISPELVRSFVRASGVEIRVFRENVHAVLSLCRAALVASGTATLDTAAMGVPMVVVYRVSPLSYRVARMVVRVSHISLVNLVAGEGVVPELIQESVTPRRLASELGLLLGDPSARRIMKDRLARVRARLGRGGASERTAEIAMEMMRDRASSPAAS